MSQLEQNFVMPKLSREGISYTPVKTVIRRWLDDPHSAADAPQLGAFLAQLEDEGFASVVDDGVFIAWGTAYRLLDDPDYASGSFLLGLPPRIDIRPVISSRGSLTDTTFMVVLSGWVDARGVTLTGDVQIKGAIAEIAGQQLLIPLESWRVLMELGRFHARPAQARTAKSNQEHWAHIRREGVAAGAQFSDFLKKTTVLTPEMLRIELSRVTLGDTDVVEVVPRFDEAPARWIEIFDRLGTVPERYEIPDGSSLVHVLVSPEVRTVLSEIKRLPGRRVAGERAEAFVRNPFSVLGPDAARVISPEQFEEARQVAGIKTSVFQPEVRRDDSGRIDEVALVIETIRQDGVDSGRIRFDGPNALSRFLSVARERLGRNAQCLRWQGCELELLGDAADHVRMLSEALDDWIAPNKLALADILDLQRYSERIEGFGAEEQYNSPYIARKKDDEGWFPENLEITVLWSSCKENGASPVKNVMTPERVAELERAIENARIDRKSTVTVPGTQVEVGVEEAEHVLRAVLTEKEKIGRIPKNPAEEGNQTERLHLQLKSNIDALDYQESRAAQLKRSDRVEAVLPSSLRSEISLRRHQLEGVAWLQNLWRHSPDACRGALLADDMGLGKTLQLLTFVAAMIESQPDPDPVLVVAPVALLENWREEIEKFFAEGALPLLTLYGNHLTERRLPKAAIDEQLRGQGLTRLLKSDWRGSAKVVLTTYETLRDLEFSLAAEKWSVMICDEAQKIKNPNAMVTRAAKKQNVRFRVACTGTPVENTLTDLWCLFDFVQPGLLRSLAEFGETYRRPIEASTDEDRQRIEELRSIIEPQILRRTKADVAKDLPAKIESSHSLPISAMQMQHYNRVLTQLKGASDGRQHLEMIQVLRRVVSDPFAFDPAEAERTSVEQIIEHNPKMRWLIDQLSAIRARGEKAIVFCEFRELQRMIQRCLSRLMDIQADIVNGDTSADAANINNRQRRIRRFQEAPGFGVIILSPLAVGFGVNIQAANHVIHFSRTWNPAKEDQATDRAYRIGQTREVRVYYPMVSAQGFKTFDERLHELLTWKRSLSADMLNGTGELRAEDFIDLGRRDGTADAEGAVA